MKIIDLHCDTLSKLLKDNDSNLYSNNFHVSIENLIKGNYLLQAFACFIYLKQENPLLNCYNMIDKFYEQTNKYSQYIKVVKSYEDIKNSINDNKILALLTLEEGGVINNDINELTRLYEKGVRMVTLTWNFENSIAYPNYGKYIDQKPDFITPNTKLGLKEFGIEVVRKMNELGMIIDVSHLSDKGFYDVIKYSTKPVVASHSNSRFIHYNLRNLTDDMILKLKENKGVIGINYYHRFVSDKDKTYVSDLIKHIKHIVSVGGIDIVSLGSDFDGIDSIMDFENCRDLNLLVDELKKEFTNEEVEKILQKNALRVFEEVLK